MKHYFDSKTLGDDIIAYRTKKDMRLLDLSLKTGLSVNMLYRMEVGKEPPKCDMFYTLCVSLGLDRNKYFKIKK